MGVPELAEPVASLTRGHTLYVVEALRAVAEAPDHASADAVSVPQTLREAVLTTCGGRVRNGGAVAGRSRARLRVRRRVPTAALLEIPLADAVQRAEGALAARLVVEVQQAGASRFRQRPPSTT